jgi:very-short-patch-repair endonuclease
MEPNQYTKLTQKSHHEKKPRTKPLPKATEKYLEAFKDFEQSLNVFQIKYEKLFQFESTKHWRFDFHLIEHRILVEISGGPWSGGRKGKLKDKAWSMERYDVATDMGYTVIRLESAPRYKIQEDGPLQIEANFSSQWLKNLKRHIFNGTDQTISTDRLDRSS